jgi:MerR family copper efflux transcriptional regulator
MEEQRISDIARKTGFTPPTIRYYEKIGLLPEPSRTEAGYRLYGDEALYRLHFIGRAKRLNLSLDEIRELLVYWSEGDCLVTREHLQRLLFDKIDELRRAVQELSTFSDQLEDAYRRLAGHSSCGRCSDECGCPPDIKKGPPPAARSKGGFDHPQWQSGR